MSVTEQGDRQHPATAPPDGNVAGAQVAPRDDQKSVPDGPPRPNGERRTMGPGSVAGTMVTDPEIRFTQTGKAMTKCRVAVNNRVKEESTGKWIDGPTSWVDVIVWSGLGERVADELRKGDRVLAVGSWQEERWFGADQEWHSKTSLTAREMGPSMLFKSARILRDEERSKPV